MSDPPCTDQRFWFQFHIFACGACTALMTMDIAAGNWVGLALTTAAAALNAWRWRALRTEHVH